MITTGLPSILELYRVGHGPSSSHTMGPVRATQLFVTAHPGNGPIRVTLYGSLAATGRGHLTDTAVRNILGHRLSEIIWLPDTFLPRHPNALQFDLLSPSAEITTSQTYYSVGGGALATNDTMEEQSGTLYTITSMEETICHCESAGYPLWRYIEEIEGSELWFELEKRWQVISAAMTRGLNAEGVLPGGLHLERRARSYYRRARHTSNPLLARGAKLSAYALAVSEENAAGSEIVTAPTCGACSTLPAVLRYCQETFDHSQTDINRALAIAGLVGNLVKVNGSISGAEVGCQGEIGTACAMAAAAAVWMMGGSLRQIEYAAEMGIEHHLGLTCDPVMGLVQIPCIERNAFAAMRAIDCAEYALLSDGRHMVSFDDIIRVMLETGRAMPHAYRETSLGGLAALRSVVKTPH